jgi:hypothetical protein
MSLVCRGLLWFLGLAVSACATPLVRDLGDGLIYLRVTELPGDMPGDAEFLQPCVIDLRFASGDADGARALFLKLELHVRPDRPIFVLTNAGTDGAIQHQFSVTRSRAGMLTLGEKTNGLTPDIVIPTDPDTEKRAYEALPITPDITTLLKVTPIKIRYDEAALTEARSHGRELEDEPAPELTDPSDAEKTPEALIDQVLLRATQIYHAWRVLKSPAP